MLRLFTITGAAGMPLSVTSAMNKIKLPPAQPLFWVNDYVGQDCQTSKLPPGVAENQ
jgi:hypothetical protein